jgi:hypothetical protein
VLLLIYAVVALWRQQRWPQLRVVAPIYVGLIAVSFVFFYSQLTAVVVPTWWAELHYWLPSWQ